MSNLLYAIDINHKAIRNNIKHFLSHSIDHLTRFLYEEDCNNCDYIQNKSIFRIYFDTTLDEDKKLSSSISLRGKVKLPKTKNRLYLTFDKESLESQENRDKSEIRDISSDSSSQVGLKYYFKNKDNSKLYTKLGTKVRLSNSSDIYLKLGGSHLKKFNKFKLYSYANEYYYTIKDRFHTQFGLNISKKIDDFFDISLNNEITKRSGEYRYLYNSLILDHSISKKDSITYWSTLSSYFNSSPSTKSISINIKYHKQLNSWIFYEIIPSITKELEDKREINRYINVNFGFIL
jgi:hypothetical protein